MTRRIDPREREVVDRAREAAPRGVGRDGVVGTFFGPTTRRRTIVAGGRDFRAVLGDDRVPAVRAILDRLHRSLGIVEVVSGGARGADAFGEAWASERGIPVRVFRPDWDRYGRSAGAVRNVNMASYADALVAFPGGAGTAHMVRVARERGLVVVEVPWAEINREHRAGGPGRDRRRRP